MPLPFANNPINHPAPQRNANPAKIGMSNATDLYQTPHAIHIPTQIALTAAELTDPKAAKVTAATAPLIAITQAHNAQRDARSVTRHFSLFTYAGSA